MSWACFGAPLTATDWNFSAPCRAGLLSWKAKQRRKCNVHSMCSSWTTCQQHQDFHSIPLRHLASTSCSCAEGQHRGCSSSFLSSESSKPMLSVDLYFLSPQAVDSWPIFNPSPNSPLGFSLNNLLWAAHLTTGDNKGYQSSGVREGRRA